MRVKVQGGVIGSVGPLGLCGTCRWAHVRETKNNTLIICQEVSSSPGLQVITSPVLRCRDYQDVNQPTKRDFEQIAWLLNADEKTKKVGFDPPKKE